MPAERLGNQIRSLIYARLLISERLRIAAIAVGLVMVLAPASARGQAGDARFREALRYLDADAGLIVSVKPPQLQALQELWVHSMPDQKGASDLVALGAIAILGFNPLQTRAWQAIGIDTEARLLAQIAAIDPKAALAADRGGETALWRTRIVLPATDVAVAAKALSMVRLRDRTRMDEAGDPALMALLGVAAPSAERVRRKLLKAGVFMMGRPAPMNGLVLASARGNFIVIDWLAPYGPGQQKFRFSKHEAMLMAALARRPDALPGASPGAVALTTSSLAVWIQPVALGGALAASEVDGLPRKSVVRRHRRCEPFGALAKASSFTGITAGLDVAPQSVEAHLRWLLPEDSDLLEALRTEKSAVLAPADPLLRVVSHLANLGSLRGRTSAPLAKNWDVLWNKAKACGRGSKLFALAVAWPEIAGLFLRELSALHPGAAQVIGDLGAASLLVSNEGEEVHINGEAWLRAPGNAVATRWLATLFGNVLRKREGTRFGTGTMQPYSLARTGGSIVGTGLRPGSRSWAMWAKRETSKADALLTLSAQPAALVPLLPELGWLAALQSFTRARGTFAAEPAALHFDFHLDQD